MRVKRNRSAQDVDAERSTAKRRKSPKSGVPRLSLWEVGVGAVWK